MLDDVLGLLRCPVCGEGLGRSAAGPVRCAAGHSFDVARQGYLNLLTGAPAPGTADTAAMVAAREGFLASGHYAPLTQAITTAATELVHAAPGNGCVVDVGAGTGRHLGAVLDALPGRVGLALDVSKYALRRAARAHPRAGAVVWDVWRPFPVADGVASLVLDVFSPRNAAEFHRVLVPGGGLLVVTPAPGHLRELAAPLGLLTVDERKDERLGQALGTWFRAGYRTDLTVPMLLTHEQVAAVVGMGPSARHIDPAELPVRIATLPSPVEVTATFHVSRYIRRADSGAGESVGE
ncbi:MAG: 23S rRNA methyltransferase [Streptosporangiales bacterium]|nr:23S rRNA methyltransferase [Streptosporangiales bacterium]